jgi:hypothetical protein
MQVLQSFSVQKFVVPAIGTMVGFIGRRDRDSFIFSRSTVLAFVPRPNPTAVSFQFVGSGGGSFLAISPAAANFVPVNPAASGTWLF